MAKLTINDFLTLAVAVYGAVLATILGIREITQEKRKVRIILEYIYFYEVANLIITNIGHRPITITKVNFSLKEKQNGLEFWDDAPANAILRADAEADPLPSTITDGEFITLELNGVIGEALLNGKNWVKLSVYDIEGNEYTKFSVRYFNAKWGRYEKYSRPEDYPFYIKIRNRLSNHLWNLQNRKSDKL